MDLKFSCYCIKSPGKKKIIPKDDLKICLYNWLFHFDHLDCLSRFRQAQYSYKIHTWLQCSVQIKSLHAHTLRHLCKSLLAYCSTADVSHYKG
jgi:integrase